MTESTKSLALDTPWGIGEKKYSQILSELSSSNIERILEFGSGVSTARFGKSFPDARILSVEDHPKYYERTVELLREHNVSNASVLHCPLMRRYIGIRTYLTYALNTNFLDKEIDFVFIDGPVEAETLRGREAPLYMAFPFIKVGGIIVLDDYHRESAKAAVRNWLKSYKANLKIIKEYEDIVVLEKCGHQNKPAYPGIYSIMDNWYASMRLGVKAVKRFFNSLIKNAKACCCKRP